MFFLYAVNIHGSCSFSSNRDRQKQLEKIQEKTNCCVNTVDNELYNRKSILESFAKELNLLIPGYSGIDNKGFNVSEDCQLTDAFIWDISDTLNRETTLEECIKFKNLHVYHFAPIRERISYSNLVILKDGKARIFKAVNCPEKGDKLMDVVQYIEDSLPPSGNKKEIISRVQNYRNYGVYIRTDEQSGFICK